VNIISGIARILFSSEPAEFASAFSLDESVARLDLARGSALSSIARESATGTVGESRVVLKRVIPLVRNSFKPYFVGRFEQRAAGVVLVGRFTMHWSVKLFMIIWLGLCLLWTAMAASDVVHQSKQWFMPVIGVGMFSLGVAFVRLCQWFSRKDPIWLAEFMRRALTGQAAAEKMTETSETRS